MSKALKQNTKRFPRLLVATARNLRPSTAGQSRSAKYIKTISSHRTTSIHTERFHVIQEEVAPNLYELLVAATLWNRTTGSQARPVFAALIVQYPTPERLAKASESDLAELIRPLGLQHTRAKRLLAFAQAWLRNHPSKHRRYRKLHYPSSGCGRDVGVDEVLDMDDPREGREVSPLPTMGPYALDCFRIFHRDILRRLATDWKGANAAPGFEPEWKRVIPLDKELKAYLSWMWLKEGWIWNPASEAKTAASVERMQLEHVRYRSLSPQSM